MALNNIEAFEDEYLTENLHFRRLQKGDQEGLSQLFYEVFGDGKDPDYWHWKYYQNPAGEHLIIVATNNKGGIVGMIGTIPIKIMVGSRVTLSSQPVDVVILPQYRNRGTFLKMERIAREECKKYGIKFNYTFTIKKTYRIITKLLGFAGVCPIFNMTKVLNPTPYLRKKIRVGLLSNGLGFAGKQVLKIASKKKLSIPRGVEIAEITHFDRRFDDFWSKEAKNYEIAVVRDSQYANWRYIESPIPYKIFSAEKNESIVGFIVLKCSQEDVNRGRILDILVEKGREDIVDLLLTRAVNYFIDQDVDVITCWILEHFPIIQALTKRGFVKRETPHDLVVRPFVADVPDEYLMEKSKWYVTMGDSDYF